MVDSAEKVISELRVSVGNLEKEVEELSGHENTGAHTERKARVLSEVITQALEKVDSVHISKDAAADALRKGDRKTSRQLAVLLARRKTIVKKLDGLGNTVDKLISNSNHGVEFETSGDNVESNENSPDGVDGKAPEQ